MKLVVKKKMVDTVGKTNTYKVIVEFNGKDKEVIVDKNTITSVRMVNLSEAVTTMYPLLEPTFDTICEQIYEIRRDISGQKLVAV